MEFLKEAKDMQEGHLYGAMHNNKASFMLVSKILVKGETYPQGRGSHSMSQFGHVFPLCSSDCGVAEDKSCYPHVLEPKQYRNIAMGSNQATQRSYQMLQFSVGYTWPWFPPPVEIETTISTSRTLNGMDLTKYRDLTSPYSKEAHGFMTELAQVVYPNAVTANNLVLAAKTQQAVMSSLYTARALFDDLVLEMASGKSASIDTSPMDGMHTFLSQLPEHHPQRVRHPKGGRQWADTHWDANDWAAIAESVLRVANANPKLAPKVADIRRCYEQGKRQEDAARKLHALTVTQEQVTAILMKGLLKR